MIRIPDLRPRRSRPGLPVDAQTGQALVSIPGLALGFVLAALLGLVVLAPGLSRGPAANGFWHMRSDGYPAMVDRLVDLRLLKVQQLPSVPGLPPRHFVALDRAAFERAQTGSVGTCGESMAGKALFDACLQRFKQFQKATYLGRDMQRADPETWELEGTQLAGMRADAHRLRESGYTWDAPENYTLYAKNSPELANPWALVDIATNQPHPMMGSGSGACGSDVTAGIAIHCTAKLVFLTKADGAVLALNGRPMAHLGVVALQKGDVLAVASRGRTRSYQLLKLPNLLSMVAENGQRVRDPALATLLEQVDTSPGEPIRSSIRRDLQDLAQQRLDATLEPVSRVHRSDSFRGAILLMDGMSGEIAAAATYPLRRDQLSAEDQAETNRLSWLRQNQNFVRLLVGSTAKVPFAAAIAQAYPGLLDLRLGGGDHCLRWIQFYRTGEPSSMAGCPASSLIRDHGGSPVGFVPFIADSNNFYAMSLLRKAWLADPSPTSAWQTTLIALTCATDDAMRLKAVDACPIYPWGIAADPRRGLPLAGLRLAYDSAKTPRAPAIELFYSITGGGNFTWTTVQLAQAYARMITAHPVTPRLTASTGVARTGQRIALDRSWAHVVTGMRGVITQGTAAGEWTRMKLGQLAPGVTLYAKTGTPKVRENLGENDGKTFVLAAARTRSGSAPTGPGDICGLRIAVVNLQYGQPTGVAVIGQLIGSPSKTRRSPVREWLTAKCPEQKYR